VIKHVPPFKQIALQIAIVIYIYISEFCLGLGARLTNKNKRYLLIAQLAPV
jgi:hypothetical protein